MSAIILHHYPLSPYSEKARLAMGLKGLSWNSVEIPVWTPRPKLTPMTGGYRRTPILQIGADFYCDTLVDPRGAGEAGRPPAACIRAIRPALARAFGWWIEKGSFMNAVCLTLGNLGGKLPQELIDERAPVLRREHRPSRSAAQARHLSAAVQCAHRVAGGSARRWSPASSSASSPSAADLSAYHPIWFARQNGGPEITELLSFSSVVGPWYDRVAAIGHGKPTEMTPEQAIEVARSATPRDLDDWSPEAQDVGLPARRLGQRDARRLRQSRGGPPARLERRRGGPSPRRPIGRRASTCTFRASGSTSCRSKGSRRSHMRSGGSVDRRCHRPTLKLGDNLPCRNSIAAPPCSAAPCPCSSAARAAPPPAKKDTGYYVIAEINAKPGSEGALRDLLVPFAKSSRKEPGCLVYTLMEVISEPGRFLTFERWTNKAALEGPHGHAGHQGHRAQARAAAGQAVHADLSQRAGRRTSQRRPESGERRRRVPRHRGPR